MAYIVLSALVGKSIVEQGSNNLSLVDVISAMNITPHNLEAAKSPMIPANLRFVSLWTRDDLDVEEELVAQLALKGPSGKVGQGIVPVNIPIDLKNGVNSRITVSIGLIKFEEGSGRYEFVVRVKGHSGRWSTYSRTPLDVVIEEPANP